MKIDLPRFTKKYLHILKLYFVFCRRIANFKIILACVELNYYANLNTLNKFIKIKLNDSDSVLEKSLLLKKREKFTFCL